ncbi:OmpA family protein [Pseudomonas sp. MOIL14HWK12:I2]|uniref:OmpA family protein n=1 Tax=Pseudomonas sp. MOIL14HWK12:I2 TaxID=1033994 RepID=UPI000415A1D6|nr:OmpA family protein [Pseudomonas sp. MOIL14HWK12:I2]
MSQASLLPSRPVRLAALAVAISLGVTGCATVDNFSSGQSRTVNCLAGGFLGAATGVAAAALAKGDGATLIAGAVVGASVGCGAALAYKNRLERLKQIAEQEKIPLQVETLQTAAATPSAAPQEAGLVAQIADEGMFPTGSAQLNDEGRRKLAKLASAYVGKEATPILIVGHTDATGTPAINQAMSEQRARAVASILVEQGISRDRMYFQGAGASRPIADNSDPLERGKNRRVEIVELNDKAMLVKRINAEKNNAKYLAHGTATESVAKPESKKPAVATASSKTVKTADAEAPRQTKPSVAKIDFGGQPVASGAWKLGQALRPKSGGFTLISTAYAQVPMSSCQQDAPRVSGEVKSFATGAALSDHATREYLPGMNGRAWAGLVNGHLVTLSPVAVLRDNAALVKDPKVFITQNYEKNKGGPSDAYTAVANTYEGEDAILYRVFLEQPEQAPVSCIDVVIKKTGDKSIDGDLFYDNGTKPYIATYAPVRG